MVKLNNIIVSNFLDVNTLNGQKKFFFYGFGQNIRSKFEQLFFMY